MGKTEQKNWDDLQGHELKNAVRSAILGSGMAGATEYASFKKRYYDHASQTLQNRIDKVLTDLIEEVDPRTVSVGGRAIYICSEIQAPEMLRKLGELGKVINSHLDYIESSVDLDSCIGLFEYIAEFNKAAGELHLLGAQQVLSRQVSKYTKESPVPLTKEYYLHYMCAKSALPALGRISTASE